MKSSPPVRFQLPIFHWLFLLFLASGISDFQKTAKQVFRIESVSQGARGLEQPTQPVRYTGFYNFHFHSRNKFTLAQILRQLAAVLSICVKIILKAQLLIISRLAHHTLLHFRNCYLSFVLPQHTPAFIYRSEHC
ncbi:hypothetical protein [Dyadobacter helix]|nr:hypothetical protein [Dyadobacter sp. CECT 9275]